MKKDPKTLAICLVSGGMDSITSAAIAHEEYSNLAFMHLNYGQKTEEKELECFHLIADHYGISNHLRKVVDVNFFGQIGGSSLTDINMEVTKYKGDSKEIPTSYVPFRNTHILAMAVSWAEVLGATKIYIGAVAEDSSGYPDCRPEYYKVFNNLIKVGTKAVGIEVITPIIHMQKSQIILKAISLKAPLQYTWSCYARQDLACGECDSCALRLRGFKNAGITDPIPYVNSSN